MVAAGRIQAALPDTPARPTSHAFIARYRANPTNARVLQRFRAWLTGEARATARWVDAVARGRDLQIRTRTPA